MSPLRSFWLQLMLERIPTDCESIYEGWLLELELELEFLQDYGPRIVAFCGLKVRTF